MRSLKNNHSFTVHGNLALHGMLLGGLIRNNSGLDKMANRPNVNIFLNKEWVTLSFFWPQGKFHTVLGCSASIGRADHGIIIV